MSGGSLLQWLEGAGWLVLVGGGALDDGDLDGIFSDIIANADAFKPVVYIAVAAVDDSRGEAVLEVWQALDGAAGYVLALENVADADDPEVVAPLREAGVVYLGDGPYALILAEMLAGTLLAEALAEVYARGGIIVGEGAGAIVLGRLVAELSPKQDAYLVLPGLNWVTHAVIEPHFETLGTAGRLQHLLKRHPDTYGIGLPHRVALALTPEGDVLTLGTGGQATITLGGREAGGGHG